MDHSQLSFRVLAFYYYGVWMSSFTILNTTPLQWEYNNEVFTLNLMLILDICSKISTAALTVDMHNQSKWRGLPCWPCSTHSEVCFSLFPMLFPDRQAQPAARRTLSSLSGQREDESISQDDPIPGVLGSCQTFRQSPPSRQHDHRQRQNQHQSECCSFSDANTKVQIWLTHGPILLSGRSDGPVPLPDETRKVSKRHIYDTWSLRPQDSLFKQLHRTTFILLMYQFFLSLTLNPGPNPRGGGLKKNSMNGWFAPLTALTHKSK